MTGLQGKAKMGLSLENKPLGGVIHATIELMRHLINVALPCRCLQCGIKVAAQNQLCPSCWGALNFITDPVCAGCGLPFDYDPGTESYCGLCHGRDWAFTRARSVLRYDEASRELILAFKHADRLDLTPLLTQWLAQGGSQVVSGADMIVPVPLHRRRLFHRLYNQSALLAQGVAQLITLEYQPHLLQRQRHTPSQGGLNMRQRDLNMRGAFKVSQKAQFRLRGKIVVLVDDVFTTGATVEACAKALRRAGAKEVRVLCLARVIRPQAMAQ